MASGKSKKQNNDFRSFTVDIRKDTLQSPLLFTGQEEFLINWAVSEIRKKYINPLSQVLDDIRFSGEEGTADAIMEAAATPPLMSKKKVIWVRDNEMIQSAKIPGESIETLIKMLPSVSDRVILIFSAETADGRGKMVRAIRKNGSSYTFDALDPKAFRSFALKRFKNAGLRITTEEMSHLVEATGYFNRESQYRLYNFENDLEKIIALSDHGMVTREAVDSAIDGDNTAFIFDLLDSISGDDKKKAFEMIHARLSEGKNEALGLVGMIVSQFELLYEVRELMEDGMNSRRIHEVTGVHEFRIRKAVGYAQRYSLPGLRQILIQAYDMNKNIVSGLMEPETALEFFVAGIRKR